MKRNYKLDYIERRILSPQDFFQLIREKNIDKKFEEEKISEIDIENKINCIGSLIVEPSYYSTALKLFHQGKEFSFLIWQDFYQFIFEWLASEKFLVRPPVKENGFIYIETFQVHVHIGSIKCIWLLKKFKPKRPVGMKVLRQLEYLIFKSEASKGILVTTSILTKEALTFIKNNDSKYGYIDKKILEKTFKDKV